MPFDFDMIDDPDVREYMRKKAEDKQALEEAKGKRDLGGYTQILGSALTDFGNANNKPVYVTQRIEDLGKAPQAIRAEKAKYDQSGLDKTIEQGVADARERGKATDDDFATGAKMEQYARDKQQQARETKLQGEADASKAREQDPSSEESQMAQALAAKMMPGRDFSKASAAQLKASIPTIEKMYQIEQNRQNRQDANAARREAHDDTVAARAEAKADAKKEKDQQFMDSTRVDGADIKPGFRPSAKDADTVRKSKAAFDNIQTQLDALDAITKGSGTNLIGDDSNRQESIVTDIQMQLKELQNLGVLSGPDLELLRKQVPDPTSAWENAKGMVGRDSYGVKSEQFRKNLNNRHDSTLGAYGYTRGKKAAPPAFPMTVRKGSQTTTVEDADELKEAQGEGWN